MIAPYYLDRDGDVVLVEHVTGRTLEAAEAAAGSDRCVYHIFPLNEAERCALCAEGHCVQRVERIPRAHQTVVYHVHPASLN